MSLNDVCFSGHAKLGKRRNGVRRELRRLQYVAFEDLNNGDLWKVARLLESGPPAGPEAQY